MCSWHNYRTDCFTKSVHMEKLHNRFLHPVMYLSTKSKVFFQTAWAFAVILPASLLARYLNVASDY